MGGMGWWKERVDGRGWVDWGSGLIGRWVDGRVG